MRLALAFTVLLVVGWTSALSDITSADLPRFGAPLNNITISVGREAVFNCVVENLGSYKVAWLRVDTQTILTIANHVITKNHRIGVNHRNHRMWSLQIRDTRETDRGWYMCQVNTDPMSKIVGFLNVVVPPDILNDPTSTDMVVREGTNVTLRCAVTGTPKPTVTWRREKDTNTFVLNATGTELEIIRVTRKDMGPYLCVASNGVPPTVSKRIVLTVHFQPMVSVENQLIGAFEDQSLVLECRSEAYPRPITYWMKPGNETISSNDNNYKVETSSAGYGITMKLIIKHIQSQDFGLFRCVVTNSLGETDGAIKVYRIDEPHTTRWPNVKYKSDSIWKMNHGEERKIAGIKDDSMLKGSKSRDEQVDFQSATASYVLNRHIFFNLGILAFAVLFLGV